MPTGAQLTLMKARRDAAKSALKFFKKIKGVRSTNNPFAFTTNNDHQNLTNYRRNNPDSVVQSFEDAVRTGLGNCDEKGRMCYAALVSNPRIHENSTVTLCEAINYDHVFVVVTDAPFANPVNLSDLDVTTMVVDGWTEDWYFPNLGVTAAILNGLANVPNPRQLYVRIQIRAHTFQSYGNGNMVDLLNNGDLVTN
jgi:hypothetical protein